MSNHEPTPGEILQYCVDHADTIVVRETVAGRTDNFALKDLPDELAKKHMARWLSERRLPHRVLRRSGS